MVLERIRVSPTRIIRTGNYGFFATVTVEVGQVLVVLNDYTLQPGSTIPVGFPLAAGASYTYSSPVQIAHYDPTGREAIIRIEY